MSIVHFSEAEISMLRMHYLQEYNSTAKKLEELGTILNKLGITNNSIDLSGVSQKTTKLSKASIEMNAPAAPVTKPALKLSSKAGRKLGRKSVNKISSPSTAASTKEVVKSSPKSQAKSSAKAAVKAASKTVTKVAAKTKAPKKAVTKSATKAPTKAAAKPASKVVAKNKAVPAAKVKAAPKAVVAKAKKGKKVSWAKFVTMTLKTSPTPMSAPELLEAGKNQFDITAATRNKAMQALQATLFRLSKKSDVLGSEKQKGAYLGYFLKK